MILKKTLKSNTCGHRIFTLMILCLFGLSVALPVSAQKTDDKKAEKKGEKIYVDHADVLRHNQFEMPDIQVAKGNVKFRYKDMTLLCDSAYLNDKQSSFKAFGHVKINRKDGTRLTCSRIHYDGMSQMVYARENVSVKQPGKSLRCDSLDYSMTSKMASYFGGRGTLIYNGNTIVADRGDYNTETKVSNFYGDVFIRTPKYRINTPTAHGNTDTGIFHVLGKSTIRTAKGEVVHTNDGIYNSKTDYMELRGRSTITSPERDVEGDNITYNSATGNAEGYGKVKIVDHKEKRTITGESVVYNSQTSHSEGHGNVKIVDDLKQRVITGENLTYNSKTHVGEGQGDVHYIDNKNKHSFRGDYIHYTDSAAKAFGGNPGPVVKDFSEKDTLFLHADTLSMKAFNLNTPNVYRKIFGINNVRAYRTDVQAICGFMVANTKDSCLTMYEKPVVWNGNRQLIGDSIKVYMNDSTIREAYVFGNASSIEEVDNEQHYNQIYSKRMNAFFIEGKMRKAEAIDDVYIVYYPIDEKDSTITSLNYTETDTMRVYMSPERKLEKIWMPKVNGTMYPMTQVPADKLKLSGFKWFADIRPKDKNDIFRRVGRKDENEPEPITAPKPPLQGGNIR